MKIHRLSYVVFLFFFMVYGFGNHWLPVTDPVESNYALTAKEMLLSGDWLSPQIYGQYWYDKPIMIYWLIAASYAVFGITDFAARFPSTLFGALSVAFFYNSVRTVANRRLLALGSALVLGTSIMVWAMARGIVTDMVLFWSSIGIFYYAYRGLQSESNLYITIAYVFSGIAVLTKGPVGLVLPGILLVVYSMVERSWSMVKRLVSWQGILAFLVVVLPWYGYMYVTHGSDFVNTFLGLHNVTRATASEHPEQNVWWYYLAIFLVASLPWTGAILYGMYYGWRHKTSFYRYSMIMGWGVIAFYTLMATKYPTYAFISVIPFSFLGAWGMIKLLQPHKERKLWWLLIGPALCLWWALLIGSFFAPWGFWWVLRVVVVLGTAFLLGCFWYKKRLMIPITIGVCSLLNYSVLLQEALVPLMSLRSSESYIHHIEEFDGPIYYYEGYAPSIPYYTDKPMTRVISSDPEIRAKKDARNAAWTGKYTMTSISEEELIARIEAGQKVMLISGKTEAHAFAKTKVAQQMKRIDVSSRESIFMTP